MPNIATIRIKALDPEQGAFVVINEADFDPEVHDLCVPDEPAGTGDGDDNTPATKTRKARAAPAGTGEG